jgi:hypothetical protein
MKTLTAQQADNIYTILVNVCGANPTHRNNFIQIVTDDCREYRFSGLLGFGGKLRNNESGVYVDCYPEDMNAERAAIIQQANKELTQLFGQ